MELAELIAALSNPEAYPCRVDRVEVRQTHISAVFLVGPVVYKLKKPVRLGFLSFATLAERKHFCEEEVRLNRRLAPEVYLGVVPIARGADGKLRVEGEGQIVEWAVKMQRLPDEASLLGRLEHGQVTATLIEALADRIAQFHATAAGGPEIATAGRFQTVAGNARENFAQSESQVGSTVTRGVFSRLRTLTDDWLTRLRPLIDARAARGVPRDTHGDLHLDHVYHFPDRAPPGDLVAIDCIEFNTRFRYADPIADAAFVAMDLKFRGRRDLAYVFAARYLRATGDADGMGLFPFYTAYRAVVRAKVDGLKMGEPEVPEAARERAGARARAYWLLALGELEEPVRRPALVLVAGLPGSGKSTLARGLAERAGFTVVRSDVVRKELAGVSPETVAHGALDSGIYTADWNDRTYSECLRRAEQTLLEGGRVIVDANFGDEGRRRVFLDAAARLAVPALFLHCVASPPVAKSRVAARRGDASDADTEVYDRVAARWQAFGARTSPAVREIGADGAPEETLAQSLVALRAAGI